MTSLQAPPEQRLARRVVERMAGGDTSALDDLYDAHAQSIYTFAL
jgi:hypothetical protein